MRTHDLDPLAGAGGQATRPARRPETHLAAQALAEGRTEPLDASSVVDLQRAAGNASVGAALSEAREADAVSEALAGGGTPLEGSTRSAMEASLGHDFGDVRIHTGPAATDSARALNAQAYTVGNDVVLQSDSGPETQAGKRTLAHELTHVVQQRAGPVDGTPRGGGLSVSDPSDRFEQAAERSADAVMAGSVQRQEAAPENDEVLGALAAQTLVQRQDEGATSEEEELPEEAVPEEEETPTQTLVQRNGEEELAEDEMPA